MRSYRHRVGSGGIIFLGILTLWVVYLVPVLVRERTSRLESRAADRTSAAVRVLSRPAAQRPSRRVVLTPGRPVVADNLPARPTADLAAELRRSAERARLGTRIRGVAALVGVVALVATAIAFPAGVLPWWSVAAAGGWLSAVVVGGAVTASSRRRAAAPARRVAALPPQAYRVATELFDDRAAERAERVERAAAPVETRVAAAAEEPEVAEADQEWTPVSVPSPVYASKPMSPRAPALPWSMPPVAFEDGVTPAPAEPGRLPGETDRDDARTSQVRSGADEQRQSAAG